MTVLYNEVIYIGIVGSGLRTERTKILEILRNERKKHKNIIVVSGGAKGIDSVAYWACKILGIPILIYFPNLEEYATKRNDIYFERNELIAKTSDYLYAFPQSRSGGGTMNTVGHFIRLGKEKRLTIYD